MKSLNRSLLVLAVLFSVGASKALAGYFYQQVYYNWSAGEIYSVPSGAYVEAEAWGGNSWAQTQVGGGGLNLNYEAGYQQDLDYVGSTSSADNIYYNLSAGGDGSAYSMLYVGW
jgi:hypothetical protein